MQNALLKLTEKLPNGTTHIQFVGARSVAGGSYLTNIHCYKITDTQDCEWITDNDNEYGEWCKRKVPPYCQLICVALPAWK